jgi:hypothetical protein
MNSLFVFIGMSLFNLTHQNPSSYEIHADFTDQQVKEVEAKAKENLKINFNIEVLKRDKKNEIIHLIYTKYKDLNSDKVLSICESDNFKVLTISYSSCSILDK